MSVAQINVTVGTAGHIDHGKTALVRLLTGCETDRLKEEKLRGMSIELGFAPCKIAGTEVGIVDVPGHENFIKTMVAGACGMDAVVLVVAADDGVMPQTREHFDILTLLGVRHGLVALTKIDRVGADHVELARAELEDYLHGTFLEGAPILPVSNVTGKGFDAFYEALVAMVQGVVPKPIDGVFRVPVDRAFTIKGHGTVVAGIPISGSAAVGDQVELLPHGDTGRIRGIEVYGQAAGRVLAGQCAAINVGHWEHQAISRGDVVAAPGCFQASEWFICLLRMLPHEGLVLKNGAKVRLHTGTSDRPATLYSLSGDRVGAGEECLVQIGVKTPVVAGPGDHFILRTLSPVQTVGGGVIIEPVDRRQKRNRPELVADLEARAAAVGDAVRFVEYCLRTAPALAAGVADLALRTKVPGARVEEILGELVAQGRAVVLSAGTFMHGETAARAGKRLVDLLEEFHRQQPESPGMPPEGLREASGMEKAVFDGLVEREKGAGRIVLATGRLAAASHRPTFDQKDARLLEAVETLFRQGAFQPPGPEEIAQKTGATPREVDKILRILCEHRRLVRVADNVFLHQEAIARARQTLVEFLQAEGRLESVRFKYLLDTTRKVAIPLLDYFDSVGVTRRMGNTRFLKSGAK